MARIRSVHPGLWTDEQFVSCSAPARLLFIGIWNEADDAGAFEWKPLTLKMRLAPADSVDVAALLSELEANGMVMSYTAGGKRYGAVRNFCRFQSPKKPRAIHPVPPDVGTYTGWTGACSELEAVQGADIPPEGEAAPTSTGLSSEPDDVDGEVVSPFAEPVPNQFPTGSPKGGNRSADGEGEEKERKKEPSSLRSDGATAVAAAVPKPASPVVSPPLFAEPPPEPRAEPPTAKDRLWREGLARLRAICATPDGGGPPAAAVRKQIGRLVDAAGHDHQRVLDAIERCDIVRPDEPIPWLMATVRAQPTAQHPPDPWGIRAWISRQPDVATGHDADGREGPTINGWLVEDVAGRVADAAGISPQWRGAWNALGDWMRADLPFTTQRALGAIASQAQRMADRGEEIRSIAVFDAAVRGACAMVPA